MQNEWKNVDDTFFNPNSDAQFLEYSGVKRPAADAESPLECFLLFITEDILAQIVEETNRYHAKEEAIPMKWVDTTVEEIQAFLVVFAMGLVNLPEIDLRKGSIYGISWFSSVFKRTRFKQILRNLHLSNNEADLPRDDPNRDTFQQMYAPQREICLDEPMSTKSRISFIQYMPKKPKKSLK